MRSIQNVFSFSLSLCLMVGAVAHQRSVGQTIAPAPGHKVVDQATVPLLVEGNRPFIDVTFRRADGSTRSARFLVDSGGGGFLIAEPLARDLSLKWGAVTREKGVALGVAEVPPSAFLGDLPLDLDPKRVLVVVGQDNILPKAAPGHAEGLFPGHLLARYHVVFDYPNGTFTLARPNILTPKGNALPMPIGQSSGFPRTEIEVAGVKHGFLIDTGASFTMVSEVLLKSWGTNHPDWPRHDGAVGEAATLGGTTLETMFVPRAQWGPRELAEFGVVSQRKGVFEEWMSSMMSAPIVGSLAGNVLKHFRVELDYPHEKLYLSAP